MRGIKGSSAAATSGSSTSSATLNFRKRGRSSFRLGRKVDHHFRGYRRRSPVARLRTLLRRRHRLRPLKNQAPPPASSNATRPASGENDQALCGWTAFFDALAIRAFFLFLIFGHVAPGNRESRPLRAACGNLHPDNRRIRLTPRLRRQILPGQFCRADGYDCPAR